MKPGPAIIGPMRFPERLQGLRPLTILVVIYAVIWISLEGNLTRVVFLSFLVGLWVILNLAWRLFAGRHISVPSWLVVSGLLGVLLGLATSGLTLVFMSLKTGLHAHGPEFTESEIRWVFDQILLWSGAGLLAGLGVGLLTGGKHNE